MPGPSGTVARSDSTHGPSDSLTLAAEHLSRAVDGKHPLEGLHRCGAAACAPHLLPSPSPSDREPLAPCRGTQLGDRKRVVKGKRVSVRVDLGGGRHNKKK